MGPVHVVAQMAVAAAYSWTVSRVRSHCGRDEERRVVERAMATWGTQRAGEQDAARQTCMCKLGWWIRIERSPMWAYTGQSERTRPGVSCEKDSDEQGARSDSRYL
jgi:hypothetical protein